MRSDYKSQSGEISYKYTPEFCNKVRSSNVAKHCTYQIIDKLDNNSPPMECERPKKVCPSSAFFHSAM